LQKKDVVEPYGGCARALLEKLPIGTSSAKHETGGGDKREEHQEQF